MESSSKENEKVASFNEESIEKNTFKADHEKNTDDISHSKEYEEVDFKYEDCEWSDRSDKLSIPTLSREVSTKYQEEAEKEEKLTQKVNDYDTKSKVIYFSVSFRLCKKAIFECAEKLNIKTNLSGDMLTIYGNRYDIDTFVGEMMEIEHEFKKKYYPKYWDFTIEEPLSLIKITENEYEFKEIASLFLKTTNRYIKNIERIQNKYLMDNYVNMIQTLEEIKSDDVSLERKLLFHGTRQTNPEEIYANFDMGFDLQYANAGMYGKGLYFAVQSSYSAQSYAYKTQNGTLIILVADVLLGKPFKHISSDNKILKPPIGFDSVESTHHTYILYSHLRSYPLYRIEYQ